MGADGWEGFPLDNTDNNDTQAYEFLIQFWESIHEKYKAIGTRRWPRMSEVWETGTITSVVANGDETYTLTSTGKDWTGGGDNPWNPAAEGEIPWAPNSWRVIIEWSPDDYRSYVISDILSWTADTLTIATITDYLTSKELDSLGTLAGKTFFITRGDYGIAWQQRWPEYPQASEKWAGTVTSFALVGGNMVITDEAAQWTPDQWVGFEFIVRATDGLQKRVTITANTSNTLTFPAPDWEVEGEDEYLAPGSAYVIIALGGVYRLGRRKWQPWAWYRGAERFVYAHLTNDSIGPVQQPKISVSFLTGTAPFCDEESFPVFDGDLWSASDNDCSKADYPYGGIHLFKSFRALQNELVSLCPNFIEEKNWDASTYLENFSPATFFYKAGINAQAGTLGSLIDADTGTIAVSGITLPAGHPLPISAYFAIINEDEADTVDGILKPNGTLLQGTLNIDDPSQISFAGIDESHEGKKLVISFGWTRFKPREFRYLYPTQFFLPDSTPEDGTIDPAAVIDFEASNCLGTGIWSKRAASSKYVDHTSGAPAEAEDFVTGQLVRWIGDNWSDGIVPTDSTEDGQADLTVYYDHPNVSRHPPETAAMLAAQRSGTATGGSTRRLQDTSKDWYATTWYAGGVGHIESGTASAGSTTTLEDDGKHAGEESGCFFNTERFPLFASAYEGYIVEVELPTVVGEETVNVWHKRVITSTSIDSGKVTVEWDEPLPSSASGKNWRIREPKYELSRYQQRTLKVSQTVVIDEGTGETEQQDFEVIITHSDDDTLFFDEAPYEVVAGARYSIQEPFKVGDVLKWDGTKFVAPTGDDIIRTGVSNPQPFLRRLNGNLPTLVKRFGPVMKGDYIDYREFYDQLKRGLDALVWTLAAHGWRMRADPDVEEGNYKGSFSYRQPTPGYATAYNDCRWGGGCDWTDPDTGITVHLPSAGPIEAELNPPFYSHPMARSLASTTHIDSVDDPDFHGTEYGEAVERATSYGTASAIPTFMASATEYFVYSQIYIPGYLGVPPDEGETDPNYITYHFNPNGDDVLFRKWSSWTTEGADTAENRQTTARFSDVNDRPATPAFPPDPGHGSASDSRANWSGYMVSGETVIVKWNVEGGMKYVGGTI
jgi:hypothetical protein